MEGLGSKDSGLHQIQQRLAIFNGTQCGFCSPGMVMTMHGLTESKNGKVTMKEVEDSLGGNICRCTGYRPILDAFKSLAVDASESLVNAVKDIEDLNDIKICPKTGSSCTGSCSKLNIEKKVLQFEFPDERKWFKVFAIEEIFDIFGRIGDKPYMLVAGNTAHGVYRRSQDIKIFIDVSSVPTLRFKDTQNAFRIGGNTTISEAIEIFYATSKANDKFEYMKEIADHFNTIGNLAVRNCGTLSGNLMMKHGHTDFGSDVFVILAAAGAKVLVNSGKSKTSLDMDEFLNFDMKKKVIEEIIFPELDRNGLVFRCLKVKFCL